MLHLPAKAKRVSLSIEKKLKILDEVEKGPFGKAEIARQYGLSSSTLSTILKNKESIRQTSQTSCASSRKRLRASKYPALENALVLWMKKCRGKNVCIDGSLLKAKAQDFALKMNIENFCASDGWIQRFKVRHGLVFKKLCGESASVNLETVQNWKEEELQDLLKQYSPDDIYNADETGLFFKQLPDKSFVFQTETAHGGKRAKERITVLVASNMSGTDKLPLLIIGKSERPRCFKGLKVLPNNYKANGKAWMTAVIFQDWLRSVDRKMKRQGRKILLFIDNCTAHPQMYDLEAVRIKFLPPNSTSVLQPMDQGIILSLKSKYRRMLLKRVILCLDNDKDYKIDILGAIHLCNEAWNQVTKETIVNSFIHAGFVREKENLQEGLSSDDNNDDETMNALRKHMDHEMTFSQFVNVDSGLQCTEDFSDEEIIAIAIKSTDTRATVCSADEETVVEEAPSKKTTFKEALNAVENLKSFFSNSECSGSTISGVFDLLNNIEDQVFLCAPPKGQTLMTDYIQKPQ